MSDRRPYSLAHRLEYWLIRAVFLLPRAAPLPLARGLARATGRLAFYILKEYRKTALDNAEMVLSSELSERERYEMVRFSFESVAMTFLELVNFSRLLRMPDLERYFEFELLDESIEISKKAGGAIFITGHIGNWELCSLITVRKGLPFCAVARPLPNGFLDDYVTKLRESCGQVIVKKRGALKGMVKQLRSGGAVAFLIDQNARKHGVMVKFMGHNASTIPSVASLAMKMKVPVIPGACMRVGNGFRFKLVCMPPVQIVDTGDRGADLIANTQRMNDAVEELVRRDPRQWMWGHRRWRIKDSWLTKGRLAERAMVADDS